MPAVFITATGTDIGKTYVTAGLARCLRQRGRKVRVLKPVVSGFDPADFGESDPAVLLRAIGEEPDLSTIDAISPWRFTAPLSPDMAARQEGSTIDFPALFEFCRVAITDAEDVLLIEGIGGLMVPLAPRATVIDLINALRIAPILVAGTYVGSLSHTLTALGIMSFGMDARAVVFNETPGSMALPEETSESLQNFSGNVPIFILRREPVPGNVNATIFAQLADCLLPA
jgi:dethiobiotin synthetase